VLSLAIVSQVIAGEGWLCCICYEIDWDYHPWNNLEH